MGPIYLSVAEYFNKRPFDINAPLYFQPGLPKEMKEGWVEPYERPNPHRPVTTRRRSTAPFRHVVDPNQMQLCSYTIATMLEMFQKQVEFTIINEDDIPEIFEAVDRYLESLRTDIMQGLEIQTNYARLVVRWRAELYKHYYRYMMENPTARAALYPNNDPNKNLQSIMGSIGLQRTEKVELDPLRARAKPPYDIDAIAPNATTAPDAEDGFEIESSLGLNKSKQLLDDGAGFNFDSFLKGK